MFKKGFMQKKQLISKSLQQIHSSAEEVISSHVQRLDRISNDIRALEEILLKAGIPFKFSYSLESKTYTACDPPTTDRYYLVWDKKRITYEKTINFKETETLPLIETKAQVRLSVENELPFFYEKIIESLKTDPMQHIAFVKSPNYRKTVEELPF